jgi:hypothetical protein
MDVSRHFTERVGFAGSFVLVAALLAASCAKKEGPGRDRRGDRRPAASASGADASSAPRRPPGDLPFAFPKVGPAGKKGDFVLAPSRNWIDEAFTQGGDNQTFIYYGGWLTEAGAESSVVKSLSGETARLPNAMILRVGQGETAQPGDVVLTAWASGSGLQRAIVVEGGTPAQPRVRYLDIDFDNPLGWAEKDDDLPANTFHVLKQPGELGTTFACKDGARHARFIAVAEAENKLLGLGFAGKIRVLERSACTPLPIVPKVKAADKLFVPVLGSFAEAKVTKVEPKIGRVWAKHEFGGAPKENAFSFSNVTTVL